MTTPLSRRRFTTAALALGLAGGALAQQDYPSRPIRIIVPVPPGGAADTLARVLADRLSTRWGQTVIVENRAGAGGNIGAELVHKAPGDGHTLLLSPPGPLSINKLLYRNIGYDSDTFVPVSIVAANPNVLLVHPKVPARTLQELIAYARANPNKLNYASSGAGSTTHLAGELLKSMAKVDIVHIPYKGGPPAFSDLLAGQVEIMFQGLATALPQIQEGKLRVLAVGSEKRHPALPDVPAIGEILPGFVTTSWTGLVAAPRTPPAVVARISAAVAEVFSNADTARQVKGLDARDLVLSSPAEAARFMREERERWGAVIRATGTTVD
jgi:tripartite-type tricarboxylate transporter receptor subunit TctC